MTFGNLGIPAPSDFDGFFGFSSTKEQQRISLYLWESKNSRDITKNQTLKERAVTRDHQKIVKCTNCSRKKGSYQKRPSKGSPMKGLHSLEGAINYRKGPGHQKDIMLICSLLLKNIHP